MRINCTLVIRALYFNSMMHISVYLICFLLYWNLFFIYFYFRLVRGETRLDVPPPSPRRAKKRFQHVDYPDFLSTQLSRSVCSIFLLKPDSLFVCPNVDGLGRSVYHSLALQTGAERIVGSTEAVVSAIDLYSDYYDGRLVAMQWAHICNSDPFIAQNFGFAVTWFSTLSNHHF